MELYGRSTSTLNLVIEEIMRFPVIKLQSKGRIIYLLAMLYVIANVADL